MFKAEPARELGVLEKRRGEGGGMVLPERASERAMVCTRRVNCDSGGRAERRGFYCLMGAGGEGNC